MNNITLSARPGLKGVRRPKKWNLRIDMTPMVDLGFLLIAFFVMTTRLSEPTVMKLAMPKEGPPMPLANSAAFNILIESEKDIYVYTGSTFEALQTRTMQKTSLAGENSLRYLIQSYQSSLGVSGFKEGREGMMMLIKPSTNARYKQIVDILDEATINGVSKYVIVPYTEEDRLLFHSYYRNWQD